MPLGNCRYSHMPCTDALEGLRIPFKYTLMPKAIYSKSTTVQLFKLGTFQGTLLTVQVECKALNTQSSSNDIPYQPEISVSTILCNMYLWPTSTIIDTHDQSLLSYLPHKTINDIEQYEPAFAECSYST